MPVLPAKGSRISHPTRTGGSGNCVAMESPLTPAEFEQKMRELYPQPEGVDKWDWSKRGFDPGHSHVEADALMTELLSALGYGAGVEIFNNSTTWYS